MGGMRIAILGSGGVGGYFGGRLAAGGDDVTFIARGAHLAALRERGLRILSPNGDVHLPVVTHADIAGHLPDAVDVLQVAFFALIVKGQQRGQFERKPGKGGHERVGHWNLGRARAMIGDGAKARSQSAKQRIRGQVFAHSRSPGRHRILRCQKGNNRVGSAAHYGMKVYERPNEKSR
jgi:hypothetical protein